MSNIPDFVMQLQEQERQLKTQMDATADDWRDEVKDKFYDKYMDTYSEMIETYINGGKDMSGKGVNDLMEFMDQKLEEMEDLSGISADVQFQAASLGQHDGHMNDFFDYDMNVENMQCVKDRGGIVHDNNRVRDYWNNNPGSPGYNGSRPGELKQDDIKEIMYENNK